MSDNGTKPNINDGAGKRQEDTSKHQENTGKRQEDTGKHHEDADKRKVRIILASVFIMIILISFFVEGFFKNKQNAELKPSKASPEISSASEDVTCPVCKNIFASNKAEYRHVVSSVGRTYYFDTESCYKKFLDDPDKYIGVKYNIKIEPVDTGAPTPYEVPDAKPSVPEPSRQETIKDESSEDFNIDAQPSKVPPAPSFTETPSGNAEPQTKTSDEIPNFDTKTQKQTKNVKSKDSSQQSTSKSKSAQEIKPDIKNFDFEIPQGATQGNTKKLKTTPIAPPPGVESHTY